MPCLQWKFYRKCMLWVPGGGVKWCLHGKFSANVSLCSLDSSACISNIPHIPQHSLQHTWGKSNVHMHSSVHAVPTDREQIISVWGGRDFNLPDKKILSSFNKEHKFSSLSFRLHAKLIENHTQLNFYSRSCTSLYCRNIMSHAMNIPHHVTYFHIICILLHLLSFPAEGVLNLLMQTSGDLCESL